MAHLLGEVKPGSLRVVFDRRLKLEFYGSKISSDAGLLTYRELDRALGLTDLVASIVTEARRGRKIRHLIEGLFRQSGFGRLAGYEDVNDAEQPSLDPAMRAIVDTLGLDRAAASTSKMWRFETNWLARDEYFAALVDFPGVWIDRVHEHRPPKLIVLDMGSSQSPTPRQPRECRLQRPFRRTCLHPLFVFNQFGDMERCALRPDNVHSVDGWTEVLDPVMARYRDQTVRRYFHADVAFAMPGIYEFLGAENFKYAIPLPANRVLPESIGHLLARPVGRPPNEVRRYYASFGYQVGSWDKLWRVVDNSLSRGASVPRIGE